MELFNYKGALEINRARIQHLDTLNLNFTNKSVLETGCGGKGDITRYLLSKNAIVTLHLFSFKTPILQSKKIRKKCKINSRNFTYDGLTFSSSFWIFEEVKDEIWKHNGRSCLSIQDCVNFIMFIEEFASLVLNTIFLFSQLTQLEHFNRRNTLFPSLSL